MARLKRADRSLRDARGRGAARAFTDEPVDDATVAALLDDARFAPSGGNRQPWRVAVVKDPAVRASMAGLMRPVWDEYVGAADDAGDARRSRSGSTVTQHPWRRPTRCSTTSTAVPVVLAVAADLRRIAMMDGNARPTGR